MNDRHPSGNSSPTVPAADASYGHSPQYDSQAAQHGYAGYDGYSTGTFENLAGPYGDADPLFGAMPGDPYDTGHHHYGTGQYDTSQYQTGVYDTGGYDTTGYDTGSYDTGGYDSGQYATTIGYGTYDVQGAYQTPYETGSYDTTAWGHADYGTAHPGIPAQPGPAAVESQHPTGQWDTGSYAPSVVDAEAGTHTWDPAEALTQNWDPASYAEYDPAFAAEPYDPSPEAEPERTAAFETVPAQDFDSPYETEFDAATGPDAAESPAEDGTEAGTEAGTVTVAEPEVLPGPRRAGSRRRTPARRSALLTVAVPSAAVMGVAGIAAASVSDLGNGQSDKTAQAAAPTVQPAAANSKLDTQLAGLTADADDFADRASRTQERIDLKQRQLEEKRRREAEAARREAMRPKFALPVSQHGLSAYYGQAGVNWMSVHTGIDFPVSYGTPVMAATDGTVRTQYNIAYGNMAIVTAPDGTETWYCHLSSTKIRSGSVKAGDVIAYSGNSGNSTGPHLHFEVHPGGGSAVDPLPWLRGHGLDPT